MPLVPFQTLCSREVGSLCFSCVSTSALLPSLCPSLSFGAWVGLAWAGLGRAGLGWAGLTPLFPFLAFFLSPSRPPRLSPRSPVGDGLGWVGLGWGGLG